MHQFHAKNPLNSPQKQEAPAQLNEPVPLKLNQKKIVNSA
jgi:hypothetical protein